MSEFGADQGLLQCHARRWLASALFKLQSPRGFQQSVLKGKMREGHGWLVQTFGVIILCSCSYPYVRPRSSCEPPTRQILFSVLQFLNLCMTGKVLYP